MFKILNVSESESVRIFKILNLSESESVRIFKILKGSESESVPNYDTIRFRHFQILTIPGSDTFRIGTQLSKIVILTLSDSDTFSPPPLFPK